MKSGSKAWNYDYSKHMSNKTIANRKKMKNWNYDDSKYRSTKPLTTRNDDESVIQYNDKSRQRQIEEADERIMTILPSFPVVVDQSNHCPIDETVSQKGEGRPSSPSRPCETPRRHLWEKLKTEKLNLIGKSRAFHDMEEVSRRLCSVWPWIFVWRILFSRRVSFIPRKFRDTEFRQGVYTYFKTNTFRQKPWE